MPVSSMSTEIAMCGALSACEKSSIRLSGYFARLSMTRAKCPASFGYAWLNRSSMNVAWRWFLANTIVLASRSPLSTLWPCVMTCSST